MDDPHQGREILVVDGSAASREVLGRALEGELEAVRVTPCGSAEEALAHGDRRRFDLITTSLLLPDMDGLALCRRFRQLDHHLYTPVVVISGDADTRLLREGFAAGVTDYFDKGRGYHALGSFVRDLFERHAPLRGRALLVEDSRSAALALSRVLERHDLQVDHVATAEEAVANLRGRADHYDLVVTDFHLEGPFNGGDLLYALRAKYHFAHQALPVLVLTGDDDPRHHAEALRAGANDFVTKPPQEEVLMARVRSLLRTRHQYKTLRDQARQLESLAATDQLTGLYNKRSLYECGAAYLDDEARRAWALLVDLDHFKQVNDRHGHLTGDRVLAEVGGLLRERFADGLAARFGGEEFAVLLPAADHDAALQRAEALRREAEALAPCGIPITVSIGLAAAADHPGSDLEELLGHADRALYSAKQGGRNRVYQTVPAAEPVAVRPDFN